MPETPADFPRRTRISALSGAAPKLAVAVAPDGSYTNSVTDDEHRQAYEIAEDMVRQLHAYALRKERENPTWTRTYNIERVRRGLAQKVEAREWDFTSQEQDWIIARLTTLLNDGSTPKSG